jgi:hypothetical protein
MAGGFEWEDPTEAFDQGVENPFKNPDLMKNAEDSNMKFDPARLLGPRLNGVNLYLIGMMGTGKSSVGDIVARREYFEDLCLLLWAWVTLFLSHGVVVVRPRSDFHYRSSSTPLPF